MKAISFILLTIMEKYNSRHIHTDSIGEPHFESLESVFNIASMVSSHLFGRRNFVQWIKQWAEWKVCDNLIFI